MSQPIGTPPTEGTPTTIDRLLAGSLDHFERAAVQVLTASRFLLARDDVQAYIEADGAVRWTDLAHAIQHLIPASTGERRLVLLACSFASPLVQVSLSEALVGLDADARAAVVAAVATAVRHQPTGPAGPPVSGEPRYPAGTPEYEAYTTELRTELGKFARGEGEYRIEQPTTYTVDFAAPVPHSQRPGMAAGLCGHAVAPSEWRVGIRYCERCEPVTSSLIDLLPQLRPLEVPAVDGDAGPRDAEALAMEIRDRITDLGDRLMLADEGDIEVTVELARGEAIVHDIGDEDLVLARGVITGPGVGRTGGTR